MRRGDDVQDEPLHAQQLVLARDTAERSRWIGAAFVAFAAVAFSGKAVIVKLAYRYGVDSVTLLALRMVDRKSTRLNSSHIQKSRMPSSA